MKTKRIGIIGGMGPDASSRLVAQMVVMAREQYGVRKNHEYPEIVLDSIPVPEFFSNQDDIQVAFRMLKKRVVRLNDFGVNCLALVCNTAHILLPQLQMQSRAPFVSMVDEVVKKAVLGKYHRVGLLASPTTLTSRLYDKPLLGEGVAVLTPFLDRHTELSVIIKRIIAGEVRGADERLLAMADDMKDGGAEAIVLGCTELPLVFPEQYSMPILSCTDILASSLLERYYN